MFKPLSHFLMTTSAYDQIVETYDIETLREIRDHGCVSGEAHDHIYYADTCQFFEDHEDEITDYIETMVGTDVLVDLFKQNDGNLTTYKNDVTWCYIELIAGQLVDQYEDITQEELSDADEYVVAPDGEVVFKADLKDAFEEADADYLANLSEEEWQMKCDDYEDIKELASTPWGQDHLQIISA